MMSLQGLNTQTNQSDSHAIHATAMGMWQTAMGMVCGVEIKTDQIM